MGPSRGKLTDPSPQGEPLEATSQADTNPLWHLTLAADVLAALTTATTIQQALQACAQAIVDRSQAVFARIWTLNDLDQVLELRASAGLYTHLDGAHSRVEVGSFKIGLIAEERRPHLTNDVSHDPRVSDPSWAASEGIVSFAGYPLLSSGRLVGVVAMFARQPLSETVLVALSRIADAIAVGVDRDRASDDRERLLVQLESQRALLDAVIEQMPSGLLVADALSGRIVMANRQVERIIGRNLLDVAERADFLAQAGYHPDGSRYRTEDWPMSRTVRTGEVVENEEIDLRVGDGRWAAIATSAAPVRDRDGAIVAGVVTFHEISARRRVERRLAAQHAAVSVLSEGTTLEETAVPFLRRICEALGWDGGSVWVVDDEADVLRTVASWHLATEGDVSGAEPAPSAVDRGVGLAGRVWATKAPGATATLAADSDRGLLARSTDDPSGHNSVAVPIELGSRVLGVLELFREGRQPADADLVDVMTAVAGQLGQFVERSRAEDAVRVEQGRRNAILEISLDCVVSVDHRGLITEFNPAAEGTFGWRRDEVVGQAMADLLVPPAFRSQHDHGFDRYLETGEGPAFGRRLELRAMRREGSEFPVELAIVRVPIDGPPAFTAFIRDITGPQKAAQALRDSREQFATLSFTLQKSLLPSELPVIAGMELAARYHPAVEGLEVGGDFYDVFPLGRSEWAVVIGDVCGKGAEAAALTALARYTIRASAIQTDHPAHVLTTLNEAILRQEGAMNERFATAVYARVSRRKGITKLTVVCGGHPPPVVIRPSGEVIDIGIVGTLLGALRDIHLVETVTKLEGGDKVVFYTDGVTEAPSAIGEFGSFRLHQLLSSCAALDVKATAARVEEVVLDYQGGISRDDMAIVVLGVAG